MCFRAHGRRNGRLYLCNYRGYQFLRECVAGGERQIETTRQKAFYRLQIRRGELSDRIGRQRTVAHDRLRLRNFGERGCKCAGVGSCFVRCFRAAPVHDQRIRNQIAQPLLPLRNEDADAASDVEAGQPVDKTKQVPAHAFEQADRSAGLLDHLNLGAACAHAGMSVDLWSFVAPHGALELPSIVLTGAAGFRLAVGLLFPGIYRRRPALAVAGADAVRLMAGIVPLLIGAGVLKGFFSPSHAPVVVLKFAVGAALFCAAAALALQDAGRQSAS